MQVVALRVLLAVNRVHADVWSLKSKLLAGGTRSPGWRTGAQLIHVGTQESMSLAQLLLTCSVIFHLPWNQRGDSTAQVHTVTALSSSSAQGVPSRPDLHLPPVQQQLLPPPQLLAQSWAVFSVFQPFLENLKQEVSPEIRAARKRLRPTPQLQHHLLHREGAGGETGFVRATHELAFKPWSFLSSKTKRSIRKIALSQSPCHCWHLRTKCQPHIHWGIKKYFIWSNWRIERTDMHQSLESPAACREYQAWPTSLMGHSHPGPTWNPETHQVIHSVSSGTQFKQSQMASDEHKALTLMFLK